MKQQFSPGDRVVTPSGRVGTVLDPSWAMPKHLLIEFPDQKVGKDIRKGDRIWLLSEILKPAPAAEQAQCRRKAA